MKRSGPLSRKTPLRGGGPLSRTAPKRPSPSTLRSKASKPKKRARAGVTPETRLYVLDRDGRCMAHPIGFALDIPCAGRPHVHHVLLRSQGGGHEPDNLLTICERHHTCAHDERRSEAEDANIIVRTRYHSAQPEPEPETKRQA